MRRFLLWLFAIVALSLALPSPFVPQSIQAQAQPPVTFTVAEVFPQGDSIPVDSAITVIFTRPVVPLTLASDTTADLPNPLTFIPPINGTGEWLNTSIYIFTPDVSLAGGTTYAVNVADSLTAQDGAVLEEGGYSWFFTTVSPSVTRFMPDDSATAQLDTTIQIRFNMPMNMDSVESAFQLTSTDAPGTPIDGTFTWSEDEQGFRFTPDALLTIETDYIATLDDTARPARGDASLIGTTEWAFTTVPSPAILRTTPADGAENASAYEGVLLYFSSLMDIETLSDKITITPAPANEPEFFYRDWNNTYRVAFQPEPSTEYTVNIAPGMADIYGNTIDEPLTFSYTTSRLTSDVYLRTPGTVGFYSAYREPTQLFLLHRNVSEVNLSLSRMPIEDFIERIGQSSYDPAYGYEPASQDRLRQWTIESTAPLNAARYELLEFDGRTQFDAECPNTLPSRLRIGDTAIVITEPDPLRARNEPSTGEILDLLPKDYELPIIGGPVCTDQTVRWWQVELRNGTSAWVAESLADEYFLEMLLPAEGTPIPVTTEDGGALAPGVYVLNFDAPELDSSYISPAHVMVVGTANLTVKVAQNSTLVWATDIQTGQPLVDMPITIYDESNRLIASGDTDQEGLLIVDTPFMPDLYRARFALLQNDEHFGIGFSDWSNGIEPYNFDQNYDFFPARWRVYAYTDRPVYRPGQPVYYRAVVRAKNDVQYTIPTDFQLRAQVYDDSNQIVHTQTVDLTEFGTVSGEFTITADAGLGYYYIDFTLIGGEADEAISGIGFSVAEYRLPEFQVSLTANEGQVVDGDEITITTNGTYFFGGAVSFANVNYTVSTAPYDFQYKGDGYYSFRDDRSDEGAAYYYYGGYGEMIAEGTLRADAQGNATIEIPTRLENESQIYTVEAVLTDESNQAVASRTQVIVHQSLNYVGTRPLSYVATVEESTGFEVIVVDWDSQPIRNQEVALALVERRWSSVQEQDANGRTTWTWEVEDIPLDEATLTTDENGIARYNFTPTQGGIYKATVTTRDSLGKVSVASSSMWVSGREYVSWRQQNSNRIDLIADKDEYNIGDTAEILITSPFQGTAEALITVERGGVLNVERITLESNSAIYQLPITGDYAPNVFVSVLIIKGVDDDNAIASFRMGYVQLNIETTQRQILIDVTTDTERAQPQDTVTYTVTTTDYSGRPVPAEVGIAVTDLASLSIAPPNSGAILPTFFGQQFLAVRTSLSLTINTDQLTQEVLDTVKGGGGGGGLGDGLIQIRGEFIDTPYWDGALVTDEDGTATFEVRLPDNLTTWRLDARAVANGFDDNLIVGQDTFDLISTKPLIIRPVTPRFFVVDDVVNLLAVVNNNTGEEQEVTIAILADGVTINGDIAQTITIPAEGRGSVTWVANVMDAPFARIAFTVQSDDFSDGSISPVSLDEDGTLPIYRYEVPETVGTAGVLRTADTRLETIALPSQFDITQGDFTVTLEKSLASATLNGLDYLRNYPHQCVEQTVSRFLPNIMTYRALNSLGHADATLQAQLNTAIEFALQKLYAEQKSDGGWGWFLNDQSDPMTTAYALIGLYEAREQGLLIADESIRDAQAFLRARFIVPNNTQPRWQMNRMAFNLYALARTGDPDIARTSTLYDQRDNLDLYAKALLAETFYYIGGNENRINNLVTDLVNNANLSASGVSWQEERRDFYNWNTDLRTSALVLSALIKLRPDSELLPNAVRYLMVQRTADAWETTQETAWAVMALTDWMLVSGELDPDYAYTVTLNDDLLTEGEATRADIFDVERLRVEISDLLTDNLNTLLFERTGSDAGALYYTAFLTAYLPVPEVEPLEQGIIVQRRYVNLTNPDADPNTATIGDIVQVRLTMIAPNALHYVVIQDPLPAGAEAINPNLETSQQVGTRPGLDSSDPLARGWGWWYFSNIEFRDEKVNLYSTYLPAGTYEYVYTMRAGIAGTYNVIPAVGQEFYFPDVYGRSAGTIFTITPAD